MAAFNIGIDFGVANFPPWKFPAGEGGKPDYRGHSPRDGAEGTARSGAIKDSLMFSKMVALKGDLVPSNSGR